MDRSRWTDWAEQMVNSGPWGAHHTIARLPAMRSAYAPRTRVAGRIIGALETMEATRLWDGVWTTETMRPDAREN